MEFARRIMKSIRHFSGSLALLAAAIVPAAFAAGGPLEVAIDRNQLGMDESLALSFSIRAEGGLEAGDPKYQAQDFDEINQYSSTFVESYYQNGRFGVRNTRRITKVLKPRRTGSLVISGIHVVVNGKRHDHPPITVQVLGSGQGTPPPPRYGGSGMGLRGMGKSVSGAPFTIRAEVDQSKVFKGQQLIVSYYLYRRARVFNIQVEKYPILDGFLREDLDLPILGQRLQSESVVLDGVAYERSLLARYAAYPLKEGKLPIDSMTIKGNYYPGTSPDIDPMNPLQGFFQQLQPREWSHRSERIEVEVAPLPVDGRPASFTGGVGDFVLDSAVDKGSVGVNEAVTFTFKIEGSGNLSSISEPKVKWPPEVEVYESKSRVTPAKSGTSSKIFEVLVIPRAPGRISIPPAEMSFFSVKEKAYKTVSAAAFTLEVTGSSGTAASASGTATSRPDAPAVAAAPARLFLPDEWQAGSGSMGDLVRKLTGSPVLFLALAVLVAFGGGLLLLLLMRRTLDRIRRVTSFRSLRKEDERNRSFDSIRVFAESRAPEAAWAEVVKAYDELALKLNLRIEEITGIPARALGREELFRQGVDSGKGEEGLWKRMVLILEYSEWVRFGSSAGVVSEQEARSKLSSWVAESERVLSSLKESP